MEFPITDLLSHEESEQWLGDYFHPEGWKCPGCRASAADAYVFRQTKKSQLTVYRCRHCQQIYNLYSGTVFQQRHLTPPQVILLLRGVLKGEPTTTLAAELGVSYQTVLNLRHDLQANARRMQPDTPLPDNVTESDEMFQNAGEKRRRTLRRGGSAAWSGE
jgi:transposase-like protein